MALIKCPECGKGISNKAKKCPNCGYTLKKTNKKIILIFILLLVIALFVIYKYQNRPYAKAVKLVLQDYGQDIRASHVYYNKEDNGCLVYFSCNGTKDIAAVQFTNGNVGYDSTYNALANSKDDRFMDYVDCYYDPLWRFNLEIKGEDAGWKEVK